MRSVRDRLLDLLDCTLGRKLLEQYFGFLPDEYLSWKKLPIDVDLKNLDDNISVDYEDGTAYIVFNFRSYGSTSLTELGYSGALTSKVIVKLLWGFCFGRICIPEGGLCEEIREYLLAIDYPDIIICGHGRSLCYYYDTFHELVVKGGVPRHELVLKKISLKTETKFLTIKGKDTYNIEEIVEENPGISHIAIGARSKVVGEVDICIVRYTDRLPILDDFGAQRMIKSARK
jgi:hypothetical protein